MAKFKVGDRVVSIKTGRKGKIVSPGGRYNPMYGHNGHHEMWNVLFDDEKERIPVLMGSEEIRLANSRACNAKFKVGDVVSVKREAAEMIDNPALARKRGRVTKVLPGGYYEVDGELGATGLELTDAELILANSHAANSVVANALKACGNAIGDINSDMKGVYETAKKMISAGATHKSGYYWSIPKTYATGVGVVASRVGGAVKVVRDDPDRQGFVIAEVTDPLAQALERKGVMNACGVAKNAKFATDQYEFDMLHEAADKLEEVAKSIYYQGDKSTYAKYKDEIKRLADRAFRISQHG